MYVIQVKFPFLPVDFFSSPANQHNLRISPLFLYVIQVKFPFLPVDFFSSQEEAEKMLQEYCLAFGFSCLLSIVRRVYL